jgi:hypothetical protein
MTIEQSIRKINAEKIQAQNDLKERQSKAQETEILLEFLTDSFTEFIKQLHSGKYDVNVKFPTIQNIRGEVSVDGLSALLLAIQELNDSTQKNKLSLPETQKIEGEVLVTNQIEIPDFPEYPKSISVDNQIDYTKKLDEIKEELSKIEIKPEVNVETKASDVLIDLSSIKSGLESIVEEIKRIQVTPEVNIDLKGIEKSTKETTQAIKSLSFPVPNFKSSWSHSLSMRADDFGKTFAYTTDGTKKVVESITVNDEDGGTYRKTYAYSGDGSGDPVSESAWKRV